VGGAAAAVAAVLGLGPTAAAVAGDVTPLTAALTLASTEAASQPGGVEDEAVRVEGEVGGEAPGRVLVADDRTAPGVPLVGV